MGKIGNNVQQVPVKAIKPYERNAKDHSAEQVEKIAASIQEFGFLSPCLIDRGNNLIAGHGRVEAAKLLGLEAVPCICVDDLTEAQKRAYIIADNKLTEMGAWNYEILEEELAELNAMDFDVDLTGFEIQVDNDWFETRERWDDSGEGESEEYNEFLEKFEQKKTTDDCYTPDAVYDAAADYVAEVLGVPRDKMIRPFYPGGDYVNEKYPKGYAVVDNPPFSIMSEIVRFYTERDIPFFLFAPTLTLFSAAQAECCTAMPIGVAITYENGACVNTSFLTNMVGDGVRVKTDPVLYERMYEANKETLRDIHKEVPKYARGYHGRGNLCVEQVRRGVRGCCRSLRKNQQLRGAGGARQSDIRRRLSFIEGIHRQKNRGRKQKRKARERGEGYGVGTERKRALNRRIVRRCRA